MLLSHTLSTRAFLVSELRCAKQLRRSESTVSASADGAANAQKTDRRSWRHFEQMKTHWLTFPLVSPEAWSRAEEFRTALRAAGKPLGLLPENIIPKLEDFLELKVACLTIKGKQTGEGLYPDHTIPSTELEKVTEILQGLRDPIRRLLTADGRDGVLRIPFWQIRPFATPDPNLKAIEVLLCEPAQSQEAELLNSVNRLS
ncbi:hypothetical protein K439DRAFT_699412 [Ramaria rubella]|nr:hypothetical protein K439DRAFT_699412 [Ramaria rubella]